MRALCTIAACFVACSSAGPEPDVRVESKGVLIPAGTEIEYCEVVTLPGTPGEELWVHQIRAEMTRGSHHLIVSAIDRGSEMDRVLQDGFRAECPLGARQLGEELVELFGSQKPEWEEALPAGVGRKLFAGQKLILDYHYFNATRSELDARITLSFHTARPDTIEHLFHTGGFFNVTIDVPSRETKSFFGECRLEEDVVMHHLTRHTHKWGKRFAVNYAGGPRDGELAFESNHYEDTEHVFAEPVVIRRGEGFRFECEYFNTESHPLVFGNTVKDEMCILFFGYWGAEAGKEPPIQGCFLTEIDPDGIARD